MTGPWCRFLKAQCGSRCRAWGSPWSVRTGRWLVVMEWLRCRRGSGVACAEMADHPPLDVDPDRVLAWMDGAEDAELDAMAAQETDAK